VARSETANRESTKQEEAFAERESNRNDFISQTDSFLISNFEGFKVQLGNERDGFEDFIKPENLNEIKISKDSNNIE
jgi:hypothetical protein